MPLFLSTSSLCSQHNTSVFMPSRTTTSLPRSPCQLKRRSRKHCSISSKRVVTRSGPAEEAAEWVQENMGSGAVTRKQSVGYSDWSTAYTFETDQDKRYFVKVSPGRDASMFAGEAEGLKAMYATNTLRIPEVHHYGPLPGRGSFIVMEHLKFGGRAEPEEFGRQLALMHTAEPALAEAKNGSFGFSVDNTIGATPQPNGWKDDWVNFYRERRLAHQLKLAKDSTLNQLGDKLLPKLDDFFSGIEVKPSIIHGDLWSGNMAAVEGRPSVYDPAVYYAHHEAEFGMSWCASFSPGFYAAYHEIIPKEPGFEERKQLYLLYHYLNHYNLFGGGYRSQCVNIMRSLA